MFLKVIFTLLFILHPTLNFQLFAIGSLGVTTTDFFILVLNFYFLYRFVWFNDDLEIPKTSIHLYIFFIFIFSLLSVFNSFFSLNEGYLLQFLKTFAHFLYLYLFLFFALTFRLSERLLFSSIKLFLLVSILLNTYGIYQLVARALDLPFAWVDLNNVSLLSRMDPTDTSHMKQLALKFKDFYRATSIFSEPSVFVMFNLVNLIFLAIPFLSKTKKFIENKFLLILTFVLIAVNLLISFSLTAVLGLFLIFFISLFLERKELLKIYSKIFVFVLVLLLISDYYISQLVGLSVLEMLVNRVLGVFEFIFTNEGLVSGESLTWRLEVVLESFNVWLQNPILGVGLGLFSRHSEIASFSDNSFLSLLAEAGPFAALSFFFLFASIFYHSVKIRKEGNFVLNEEQRTLLYLVPYIMIILFEVNFITANGYLSVAFVFPIFICLSTLNSVFSSNNQTNNFKFGENNFYIEFNNRISNYLNSKSKIS